MTDSPLAHTHNPPERVTAYDPGPPYRVATQGGCTVVAVVGDLDVLTGPGLTAQLGRLIGPGRAPVVLDLAGLDFLDASGITALVVAVRMADVCQVRLRLARVPARAARVLDLGWPFWRLIVIDTVAAAGADRLSADRPHVSGALEPAPRAVATAVHVPMSRPRRRRISERPGHQTARIPRLGPDPAEPEIRLADTPGNGDEEHHV
jgi:anti-sigma B factor antagonist